jgi:hypothetical protein
MKFYSPISNILVESLFIYQQKEAIKFPLSYEPASHTHHGAFFNMFALVQQFFIT